MKYIKKFEYQQDKPEIGDYVLLFIKRKGAPQDYKEFLNNNIGQIINIKSSNTFQTEVRISYDNVPENIKKMFHNLIPGAVRVRTFDIRDVYIFGKTPEDVETKLAAKKYNL